MKTLLRILGVPLALLATMSLAIAQTGAPQVFVGGQVLTHDQVNAFAQAVDNIAALRLGVGTGHMTVILRGATAPGDGGGGQFYWNGTSAAADDGVSVIQPTGYSGVGRWLRASTEALVSSIAPSSPFLFMLWANTALAPAPLNVWDGTSWVAIGTLNRTTHVFTPANALLPGNNLSDLVNAALARANLGLAIGTNVEAWSANLDALATLAGASGKFPYFTAPGTIALGSFGSGLTFSGGTLSANVTSVAGKTGAVTLVPTDVGVPGTSTTVNGQNCALAASCTITASAINITPQGRLTLTSHTPVMTADVTAATTVYYDSYVGNQVPVAGSSLMIGSDEVSMGLSTSNVLSGNLYDIFGVSNGGALAICVGPAWASTSSRGTGAGTTQLALSNGLETDANSLTHCYGGTAGTTDLGPIAANAGVYLGTIYATANGQTKMQFSPASASGGANTVRGIWNAYNRVSARSISRDSNSSWVYGTATWRAADASNSNRVSYVDGLAQTQADCRYYDPAFESSGSLIGAIGCDFNSTTATPGDVSFTNNVSVILLATEDKFAPTLGLNYVQAVEWSNGTNTQFDGTGTLFQGMQVVLDAEY